MKHLIYLYICIPAIILSGCIEFANIRPPSIQEIDNLLAKQNYGLALEYAKEHQKKTPSTAINNKIIEVKKRAEQYDRTRSRAIYELINNQNIPAAKQELKQALRKYPQGSRLNTINTHLQNTQNTQISRLQAQQLLAKSEWLLRSKEIKESLQSIKPESNGTFQDPEADIEETAAELYHLGLKALQKGDLDLADSCLTMSNKLHNRRFTTSALARLEQLQEKSKQANIKKEKKIIEQKRVEDIKEHKQIQQTIQKQQQRQQAVKQREFDSLYYTTVSLLKDNQLSLAKNNLSKLNKLMPGNQKLKPLNKEFEEKLPAHVDALLNRGRQLYINGKIAKAKNIWVKALTLDPQNEQVKKNIERADRVLGRLDELKKKNPN